MSVNPSLAKQKRGSRFERHRSARILAIQACFEAQFHNTPLERIIKSYLTYRFKENTSPVQPDRALFIGLLQALGRRFDVVEDIINQSVITGWDPQRMDPMVRAILKVGIAEIIEAQSPAPTPVLISEYVEITKGFFEDKESAYINKVLDMAAKTLKQA
jgi:N utilization substance protein B